MGCCSSQRRAVPRSAKTIHAAPDSSSAHLRRLARIAQTEAVRVQSAETSCRTNRVNHTGMLPIGNTTPTELGNCRFTRPTSPGWFPRFCTTENAENFESCRSVGTTDAKPVVSTQIGCQNKIVVVVYAEFPPWNRPGSGISEFRVGRARRANSEPTPLRPTVNCEVPDPRVAGHGRHRDNKSQADKEE